MSVTEYRYKKATHEQLEKCIRWCQNQFQLRDWEIRLDTNSSPPDAARAAGIDDSNCGCLYSDTHTLKANVWINIDKCVNDDSSITSTVIHEVFHILMRDRFGGDDSNHEMITRIMEPLLYRLYCRENGLKIAKERE